MQFKVLILVSIIIPIYVLYANELISLEYINDTDNIQLDFTSIFTGIIYNLNIIGLLYILKRNANNIIYYSYSYRIYSL